jgi:hypothetical protein
MFLIVLPTQTVILQEKKITKFSRNKYFVQNLILTVKEFFEFTIQGESQNL